MSEQVSVEREIAAPADLVWAMASDVTRMGEWSPETESCLWIGGAMGPVVGARFRGKNRHGKRKWSTVAKVTASEPGRSFVFAVTAAGMKVAEWAYHFEPTDAGCRVVEAWTDQRGALAKALGRPVSGVSDRVTHNRESMTTTLDRLKAAAEGSA